MNAALAFAALLLLTAPTADAQTLGPLARVVSGDSVSELTLTQSKIVYRLTALGVKKVGGDAATADLAKIRVRFPVQEVRDVVFRNGNLELNVGWRSDRPVVLERVNERLAKDFISKFRRVKHRTRGA